MTFTPFFDAETYGRSPLENCSFIAGSANPDETTHGSGYVARLSGAAAEFLSIWNVMMAGHKPFYMKEDRLCLELRPILPEWLFDNEDKISFNFLGRTKVTYHNSNRIDTYVDCNTKKITIFYHDGNTINLEGSVICEPYSRDIREGKVKEIFIELN